MDAVEVAEAFEVVESAEAAGGVEPVAMIESAETTEVIAPVEVIESVEAAEVIVSVESIESVGAAGRCGAAENSAVRPSVSAGTCDKVSVSGSFILRRIV